MSEQSGSGREWDRGRTVNFSGYQKRKKKQKQVEQGKKEQAKMRRLDQFYLTKTSFWPNVTPFWPSIFKRMETEAMDMFLIFHRQFAGSLLISWAKKFFLTS